MGAKTAASTSGGVQDWGSDFWDYGIKSDSPTNNIGGLTNFMVYGDFGVTTNIVIVGNKGGPGRNAVNEFGCHEVSGQLFQFCLDNSGATAGDVSGKNYVHITGGWDRCMRGGYYRGTMVICTTKTRRHFSVSICNHGIGFRVIRDK